MANQRARSYDLNWQFREIWKKGKLSQRDLAVSIANFAKDKKIANSANEVLRIELSIWRKFKKIATQRASSCELNCQFRDSQKHVKSASEILQIELPISRKLEKYQLSERDLVNWFINFVKINKMATQWARYAGLNANFSNVKKFAN